MGREVKGRETLGSAPLHIISGYATESPTPIPHSQLRSCSSDFRPDLLIFIFFCGRSVA